MENVMQGSYENEDTDAVFIRKRETSVGMQSMENTEFIRRTIDNDDQQHVFIPGSTGPPILQDGQSSLTSLKNNAKVQKSTTRICPQSVQAITGQQQVLQHHDSDDENHESSQDDESIEDINVTLSKKSIDRKGSTVLDHEKKFYITESGIPEVKLAKQNKQLYFENYVVNYKLPAVYVLDAHICRSKPTYSMQLTKYVFPTQTDYQLCTHKIDGSHEISKYEDQFGQFENCIQIRMFQRQGQILKVIFDIDLRGMLDGLIKFSSDDKLFVLFDKTRSIFSFYEFDKDIEELKDDIINEKFKQQFIASKHKMDLSFIENLKFDPNNNYILGFGKNKIFILDYAKNEGEIITLKRKLIEQVNDASILQEKTNIRCLVACKTQKLRQVAVFDILENHKDVKTYVDRGSIIFQKPPVENHSIRYFNLQFDTTQFLNLKISSDLDQIILTDLKEKFILSEKNGSQIQRKLTQFEDKVVHFIQEDEKSHTFHLLYSKDYDSKLFLGNSNIFVDWHSQTVAQATHNVQFPRNVEPGVVKVFDIFTSLETKGENHDGSDDRHVIEMISLEDDDFVLDMAIYAYRLEIQQIEKDNIDKKKMLSKNQSTIMMKPVDKFENQYFQSVSSSMRAISMKWPYVAFQGLNNIVSLMNAFDRRMVHQIEFTDKWESIVISETYITDSNDLFVLVQNEEYFYLYIIDLDESNVREQKQSATLSSLYRIGEPILTYHKKDVEGKQVKDLHVRGSSRKESVDSNYLCQIFIQHGDTIYQWTNYKQNQNDQKLVIFSTTASQKFTRKSDHSFFFLRNQYDDEQRVISQDIMRAEINFSTIELSSSFTESAQLHDIKSFNYDHSKDRFIVLLKRSLQKQEKSCYSFKIYELESQKMLFEQPIKNQSLIGRLKSGLYTFVDGHIYFNNEVIKIRYDLIESGNNQMYKETDLFDFYNGIFILGENQKVRANTPIDSIQSHRFGYVTIDTTQKSNRNIMLLPYLHERKIYLNRHKNNTEYFYTSVETTPKEEKNYHQALIEKFSLVDLKVSEQLKKQILGSSYSSRRNSMMVVKDTPPETFTSIICMNQTESKYYVYTQDGLMINRFNFQKQVEKYGSPVATSSNGLNFIFKKNYDYEAIKDTDDLRKKMFVFSIMNMSIFGLIHIKDVDLLEEIKNEHKQSWLFIRDKEKLIKFLKFKLIINDRLDTCVKIYCVSDDKIDSQQIGQRKDSFYVFEAAYKNLRLEKINKLTGKIQDILVEQVELHKGSVHKQRIMKVPGSQIDDFVMNTGYLFIWNKNKLKFFELDQEFTESNTKYACFEIDPTNNFASIKEIRTGSIPGLIVIIISYSMSTDTIFSWDVQDNIEIESNDVGNNYEILWDNKGCPYILQNGEVIFTKERCMIKAFDFQNLEELRQVYQNAELGCKKGHRFDGKNHNWLILGEYISLPFSYMTFVIKDKIEIKDAQQEGNVFDPEPYYYIFNRSTSFMDGSFVYQNYPELKKVLKNFEKIDPKYLEIIQYKQELLRVVDGKIIQMTKVQQIEETNNNSALHLAINSGNKKSSDLLLKYMSKIKYNSSKNFNDLFGKLVEFKSFQTYLEQLPDQTNLMKRKQILRVQVPYDDHVIKMGYSPLNYVDEKFFKEQFQEVSEMATGSNTYPVKIVSVRIGWILRGSDGGKFLDELLASKNLEFFKISTLQMLIKFFYNQFKNKLLYYLLPFYIIQFLQYEFSMHSLEYYIHAVYENKDEEGLNLVQNEKFMNLRKTILIIVTLNFIQIIFQIFFIVLTIAFMRLRMNFFMRFYNWVDITFIVLNLTILKDIYIILNMFQPQQQPSDDKLLNTPKDTKEAFEERAKYIRQIEVFGEIMIVMKSGQFLSLIDKLAPIIDTIVQIFFDIFWFVIIMSLNGLVFASAFYMISQNQIMFDDLSDEEKDSIDYQTFTGSIWYIHNLILGESDRSNFELGNNPSQSNLLLVLYVIVTFLMLIHLTNMLIAIMGETFSKRRDAIEEIKMKDQLRFVMDNWHWKEWTFKDIKQVKYIIAAFNFEDDKNDMEQVHFLRKDMKTMNKQMLESFNENTIQMKEVMNQNRGMMEEIKVLKKAVFQEQQ